MNLFVNAISSKWVLILFNDDRNIVNKLEFEILWNESSKLTWFIDGFLKNNNLEYGELENIVVVNWPWSFTWVRIISLIVNAIAFANENIRLTAIDFFSLFSSYPIVKSSSKRDLFVKYTKNDTINIVKNEDFILFLKESSIKEIYGDLSQRDFISWISEIFVDINYKKVLLEVGVDNKNIIEPLYIKKPNIS